MLVIYLLAQGEGNFTDTGILYYELGYLDCKRTVYRNVYLIDTYSSLSEFIIDCACLNK